MTDKMENLADWLRDAHAMEEQALTMLETQEGRLENYPVLRDRIRQHVEETRGQSARLEQCMERLGIDRSAMKDAGGKFMATMQGMTGAMASDEVVKGHLFSYAFEHLEIASYRSLIAAADAVGDAQTRQACEENLREEEAMAAWLAENLPETTRQFLDRSANDGEAKR